MSRIRAGARVSVTLEIGEVGCWGEDCPLSQIFRQASEEALLRLSRALQKTDWRVVGEPKVKIISAEEA